MTILGKERANAIALLHELDLSRVALKMERLLDRLEAINSESRLYGAEDPGVVKLLELLKKDALLDGYEIIPKRVDDAVAIFGYSEAGICTRIPLREDQIPESIVLDQARRGYISSVANLLQISERVVANYIFSISRGLHLYLRTSRYFGELPKTSLPEVAEPKHQRASNQGLFTRMIKKVVPWWKPRNR